LPAAIAAKRYDPICDDGGYGKWQSTHLAGWVAVIGAGSIAWHQWDQGFGEKAGALERIIAGLAVGR